MKSIKINSTPKFLILNFALSITFLAMSANAEYIRNNSKEVVLDTSSGLMWQDDVRAKTTTAKWAPAQMICMALELGGYSDWRLPNILTLLSIVDKSRYNPAMSPVFVNIASNATFSGYWSSSIYNPDMISAWYVDFVVGGGSADLQKNNAYVRCVRAGQ